MINIKFNNRVITKISLWIEREDEFTANVTIELDENYAYLLTVSTPADLLKEMQAEESNFILPYSPSIIVKKLTHEIITEAIQAYVQKNDGYWLKLCQFCDDPEISVLNKLNAHYCDEWELSELEGLDRLSYYVQKYFNVFSNNQFILEPMFILILVSLIAYCLLKPELLDFFSNFIH